MSLTRPSSKCQGDGPATTSRWCFQLGTSKPVRQILETNCAESSESSLYNHTYIYIYVYTYYIYIHYIIYMIIYIYHHIWDIQWLQVGLFSGWKLFKTGSSTVACIRFHTTLQLLCGLHLRQATGWPFENWGYCCGNFCGRMDLGLQHEPFGEPFWFGLTKNQSQTYPNIL